MNNILKDERFAHIPKDPKFRGIPKSKSKISIDERFKGIFTDKKFNVKYTVDKRGRPINQTSQENYKKFYNYSSSDEDSEEETIFSLDSSRDKTKKLQNKKTNSKKLVKEEDSESVEDKEEEVSSTIDVKIEKAKKLKSKKIKNKKLIKKEDSESADDNDETNFCSNGKLLLIKRSSEDDSDAQSDKDSDVEEQEDSDEQIDELEKNEKQSKLKKKSDKQLDSHVKRKLRDPKIDYARGEGVLFTDSSSDEESNDEKDEEDDIEHAWGELDKDAESTEEPTYRLAACNMDWDKIRAVDIMVLFNSFLPTNGYIKSVTIYPSEFGLKRIQEEDIKGPVELMESNDDEEEEEENSNNDDDNQEGSQYHREKLRKYQLNRLKYFYAVIVFDSAQTANKIYEELDGQEYESSATKLDLRFIPDEETFDQEPKEVCEKLPELTKYTPRLFTNSALQQVKVHLTWDETNPDRQEFTQKVKTENLDKLEKSDIQAYLASGTSDDESEDEVKKQLDNVEKTDNKKERLEVYKSLVKSIEEAEEKKKNKDVELELTWQLGIKENSEKLVKEKERLKKQESLTPFEKYLEKRKEKKKTKREEKKKLSKDDHSDSEDSIPSDVDMSDPYFAEEVKKMSKQKEKDKKNALKDKKLDSDDDEDDDDVDEEKQREAELELLLMDENDESNKRHFDMKEIEKGEGLIATNKKKRFNKKKKVLKEEAMKKKAINDDFQVNVEDPRFQKVFTSHLFNIDPTDPRYRKTRGTEALIQEKLKRRNKTDISDVST